MDRISHDTLIRTLRYNDIAIYRPIAPINLLYEYMI